MKWNIRLSIVKQSTKLQNRKDAITWNIIQFVKQGTKQAKKKFRFLVLCQINIRDKAQRFVSSNFSENVHKQAVKIHTVYVETSSKTPEGKTWYSVKIFAFAVYSNELGPEWVERKEKKYQILPQITFLEDVKHNKETNLKTLRAFGLTLRLVVRSITNIVRTGWRSSCDVGRSFKQ